MIDALEKIIRVAGAEIMRIYAGDKAISYKADESPLTAADLAAHRIIVEGLKQLAPDIVVISEEDRELDRWKSGDFPEQFWLVDPLDGTKEFVKGTGEFTVNIALVEKGYPVLGLVYAPVLETLYVGKIGEGAWKQKGSDPRQTIAVGVAQLEAPVFVASKDHAGPAVAKLLSKHPDAKTRSMGSSLKFCLVAEGEADVYLRDMPTMEWDTAAAQCVVEAAGGRVQTLSGERFNYAKAGLKNPGFVALGVGARELLVGVDLSPSTEI